MSQEMDLTGDSVKVETEKQTLLTHAESPVDECCHSSRTMSPRIPRKKSLRGANSFNSNSIQKDDYDPYLDQHQLDPSKLANMLSSASPSVVVTTPTSVARSPQHSSPNESGNGSAVAFRHRHNWTVDVEPEHELDDDPIKDSLADVNRGHARHADEDFGEDEGGDSDQKKHRPGGGRIDVSLYTTKKNVAQGMLDIALLSANCSQLKYLLFHYERDAGASSSQDGSPKTGANWNTHWTSYDLYFLTNLFCIGLSILLQIVVGIFLILNGRHNIYVHRYQRVADSYSNLILVTVFVITVVNIFLSVFISAR